MIISNIALAQIEFDSDRLNAFRDHLYENEKASLSVTINMRGETFYEYARALREIKEDVIIEGDVASIFRIGSITKTFTATLIMKVLEEGKLQLDDRLSEYYPDIENAEKITIEDMFRHRSGIYNFTDNGIYTAMLANATESSKVESTPESHNIGKRLFWRYFHYSQLPDAQASPRFEK
jgi:D-alanyl-D-alanine carboxypeptidase